jgi:hypothetical protein
MVMVLMNVRKLVDYKHVCCFNFGLKTANTILYLIACNQVTGFLDHMNIPPCHVIDQTTGAFAPATSAEG